MPTEFVPPTNWPVDVEFVPTIQKHSSLPEDIQEEFESLLLGCRCSGSPLSSSMDDNETKDGIFLCVSDCECVHLAPCAYSTDGSLLSEYISGDSVNAIIECGSLCACNPFPSIDGVMTSLDEAWNLKKCARRKICGNRLVGFVLSIQMKLLTSSLSEAKTFCTELAELKFTQKSRWMSSCVIWKELEIFDTETKGFGLRCRTDIEVGNFVCEYAGEVISTEEAKTEFVMQQDDLFMFIICEQPMTTREPPSASTPRNLGETTASAVHSPVITCINAKRKGNWGRFINHSCQPNLVMVPVRVDIIIPRLAFFACRNIPAGEELTVDYNQGTVSFIKDDEKSNMKSGDHDSENKRKVCRCGSEVCRKFLPFNSVFIAD